MTETVQRRRGLPVEFAQVPMRTMRTRDAVAVYAHPGTQMARLERLGLLHKVAVGYYVVVPQEHVGAAWRPTIEAVAGGIAVAAFGLNQSVLMGVTAARLHGVLPRALAVGIVAVPRWRRPTALRDRDAVIHFVERDTEALEAELMTNDLGQCLVTTPEQTVLDLAHRPDLGDAAGDVQAVIMALLPRCDNANLERIAVEQRLGAALGRVRRAERAAR
jgi:predicted transcriptional regulator of viral defense system